MDECIYLYAVQPPGQGVAVCNFHRSRYGLTSLHNSTPLTQRNHIHTPHKSRCSLVFSKLLLASLSAFRSLRVWTTHSHNNRVGVVAMDTTNEISKVGHTW